LAELVYKGGARADLAAIFDYLAEHNLNSAQRFIGAVQRRCDLLRQYPELGVARDDLGPGIRALPIWRRVVIAYCIEPNAIEIIGVFYGGQDYQTILQDDPDR